jgi:hypothetical protein
MEEEIEFVAQKISHLINNGVDINKIKLTNIGNDYINLVTKIFNFYNLKINKFNNIPIISTIIGKTFFDNLNSVESAIKSIEKYNDTETYLYGGSMLKDLGDLSHQYLGQFHFPNN